MTGIVTLRWSSRCVTMAPGIPRDQTMHIRPPQPRQPDGRRVWTEHDDELIDLMESLFSSADDERLDALGDRPLPQPGIAEAA